MRKALIIVSVLALSACGFTPQGEAVREAVKTYGAKAYDEGLENAEFFMCYAASVGSVKRKYAKDKATADAYNQLCEGEEGARIIRPSQ